jgi:hypothetical protein
MKPLKAWGRQSSNMLLTSRKYCLHISAPWITFQSLHNSVSKAKTLARLEKELAKHFAGNTGQLQRQAATLGAEPAQASGNADFQRVFRPLPRVPVLLLFWDAEPEEDFQAQAHFLFDSTVSDFLDLESPFSGGATYRPPYRKMIT